MPVTVLSAKKYKAVKKLSVILPHKCLRVGMVEEAVPEISPSKASNRNVTYKSSNPKVLAVSATGMVKAIKPGKAKITVTSCDNAKAKVSYVVEVEKRSLLNRSKWDARMHLPTNKQMNEYIATDRSPYIVCWPQSSENGSWVSAKSAKMERQYPEWQGSYSFGSDGPCFWAITSGVPGLCKPLASGTSFSVSEVAEGQPYEV